MAIEMNDLLALKNLDHGMSPYEQVKVANMQNRRAGGTAIAGLVVASAAAVAAVGGWVFAGMKANAAERVALAQNAGTAALLNQTAGLLATERAERVQGDINITNAFTGTQSGSFANQIENNAIANALINLYYPTDKMDAIRNNYDLVRDGSAGDKTEEYTKEYLDMQAWRKKAKELADEIMKEV